MNSDNIIIANFQSVWIFHIFTANCVVDINITCDSTSIRNLWNIRINWRFVLNVCSQLLSNIGIVFSNNFVSLIIRRIYINIFYLNIRQTAFSKHHSDNTTNNVVSKDWSLLNWCALRINWWKCDSQNSWINSCSCQSSNNVCLRVVDRIDNKVKVHNVCTIKFCKQTIIFCNNTASQIDVWDSKSISVQKSSKSFWCCSKFNWIVIFCILVNFWHINIAYKSIISVYFSIRIILFVRWNFFCCCLTSCDCKIVCISNDNRVIFASIRKVNSSHCVSIKQCFVIENCGHSTCVCHAITIWECNFVRTNKCNTVVWNFPNTIVWFRIGSKTKSIECVLFSNICYSQSAWCNFALWCCFITSAVEIVREWDFSIVERICKIIYTREQHLVDIWFCNFASRVTKFNFSVSFIFIYKSRYQRSLWRTVFNSNVCIRIFDKSIVFINKSRNNTYWRNVCKIVVNICVIRCNRAFTTSFNITVLNLIVVVTNKSGSNWCCCCHIVVNLDIVSKWSTDISRWWVWVYKTNNFALSFNDKVSKFLRFDVTCFCYIQNLSNAFSTNSAVHDWSIVLRNKSRNLAFNAHCAYHCGSQIDWICIVSKHIFYHQSSITRDGTWLIVFIIVWNHFTVVNHTIVFNCKACDVNVVVLWNVNCNLSTIVKVYSDVFECRIFINRIEKCKFQRVITLWHSKTVDVDCVSISVQTLDKVSVKWSVIIQNNIVHQDVVPSLFWLCCIFDKFISSEDLCWRFFVSPQIYHNKEVIIIGEFDTLIENCCSQLHKLSTRSLSSKSKIFPSPIFIFNFINSENIFLNNLRIIANWSWIFFICCIPKLAFKFYFIINPCFFIVSTVDIISNISVFVIVVQSKLISALHEFFNCRNFINIICIICVSSWRHWIIKCNCICCIYIRIECVITFSIVSCFSRICGYSNFATINREINKTNRRFAFFNFKPIVYSALHCGTNIENSTVHIILKFCIYISNECRSV